MDRRPWSSWALLSAGFVLGSSFLGLAGRMLPDVRVGAEFFIEVWSQSLVADLVFVGASLGALWVAVDIARRYGLGASVLASAIGNWAAYTLSYFALLSTTVDFGVPLPFAEIPRFVGTWGIVGLIFAAVAPAAAVSYLRRRETPEAPAGTAVQR